MHKIRWHHCHCFHCKCCLKQMSKHDTNIYDSKNCCNRGWYGDAVVLLLRILPLPKSQPNPWMRHSYTICYSRNSYSLKTYPNILFDDILASSLLRCSLVGSVLRFDVYLYLHTKPDGFGIVISVGVSGFYIVVTIALALVHVRCLHFIGNR